MSDFYKDQRKIEIKVGLVALISLIVLILGYSWLRNALQLKRTSELKVKFTNVQGIEVGDKVTVNGMEAGRISKIVQERDGIVLYSRLNLKYPLRDGARFLVQDSNLMGGKQLDITNSAEGEPLDLKLVQSGEPSTGMAQLLSSASSTMMQIDGLLRELNKPEGLFSQVKTTFEETKHTFGNVNSTLDESRAKLNRALEEISVTVRQINDLIGRNKNNLDSAIAMTPALMQKAQATLDSLQAAGATLHGAVNELTKGEGTLPTLIKDDKLYKNLLQSTNRLDSLLIDIKKNPGRYFKLKVF